MPTITNQNLRLIADGTTHVRVKVTFRVTFNTFERNLTNAGVVYLDSAGLIGVDPREAEFLPLLSFGESVIPVTAGTGDQSIKRSRSARVERFLLNEDRAVGDGEEIRAHVSVITTSPSPFPQSRFTAVTGISVLEEPPLP